MSKNRLKLQYPQPLQRPLYCLANGFLSKPLSVKAETYLGTESHFASNPCSAYPVPNDALRI